MKQPLLGQHLNEIRKQKGLTQHDLALACNIDIRTVQRILNGEVTPRYSTLNLIADKLQVNFQNLEDPEDQLFLSLDKILVFSGIIGIVHIINFIFYNPFFPKLYFSTLAQWHVVFAIIHIFSGLIFYYGLYKLASQNTNRLLKFSILFAMVLMTVIGVTTLIPASTVSFIEPVNMLLRILIGVNSIFFGFGLLKKIKHFPILYLLSGISQLLVGPLFILPFSFLHYIGIWLSVIFLICILILLFQESKNLN